jgi:RNA polymerase-associated protein LEO1
MSSADPEDQADLFGDEENEDALFGDEDQARSLNDEALDSGDDEGREDRLPGDSQQVEIETRAFRVMDVGIARQLVPNPSDGQVRSANTSLESTNK